MDMEGAAVCIRATVTNNEGIVTDTEDGVILSKS